MARTRERSSIAFDTGGVNTIYVRQESLGSQEHRKRLFNASYSSDETHPLWNLHDESGNNALRGVLDIGGSFDIVSVQHDIPAVETYISDKTPDPFIWREYRGTLSPFFPFHADNQAGPLGASQIITKIPHAIDPIGTRWAMGGTAISRCSPARPEAALSVSVVELIRDGIPNALSKLVSARSNLESFRALGKDYLNVEFGWRPFVNDIRKVIQSVANQEKILTDLSQNSGKRLRRRYAFDPIVETNSGYDGFKPWPMEGSPFIGQATRQWTEVATKSTWFSGEFVYRVPKLDGIGGVGTKARHLLGLDLTPATLWAATPWTWLADWYGNTGDVLANISAMSADDLVMRYGYLMQKTEFKVTSTHTGLTAYWFGDVPSTLSGSVTFSRKTRTGASQFGFGISNADYSPRQIAVLAALGMSRG